MIYRENICAVQRFLYDIYLVADVDNNIAMANYSEDSDPTDHMAMATVLTQLTIWQRLSGTWE